MRLRRTPMAATGWSTALLALMVSAGCSTDAPVEAPDAVDSARLTEVAADPVFSSDRATAAARTDVGGGLSWRRALVADELDTAAAALAQARAQGWRITWVSCTDDTVDAQAFKTFPGDGRAYTVALTVHDARLEARIPYHLDEADPFDAPTAEVAAADSCAEDPAAAPEAGTPVDVGAGRAADED